MKFRVTIVEATTRVYERDGTIEEAEDLAERLELGYLEIANTVWTPRPTATVEVQTSEDKWVEVYP